MSQESGLCTVTKLRQHVVEQWYAEWESPEDTAGTISGRTILNQISSHLRPIFHAAGDSGTVSGQHRLPLKSHR